MKYLIIAASLLTALACSTRSIDKPVAHKKGFIGISPDNHRYFAFNDGSPYIPVGINMINPSRESRDSVEFAFKEIETWMKNLSENGGNYVRVWLSESFWDMEEEQAGQYDSAKVKRIDRFVALARKYNLRIKFTLEHFRSITLAENNQSWATKFAYHRSKGGPLDSIRQYLTSDKGKKLFLDKVDFYQQQLGADTLCSGWELWNEMNAVKGPEDSIFFEWNREMLRAVKQRFPENLVMQSLGSFDSENVRQVYQKMMTLPGNEVAQVHRYLDLGAPMEICHESMDIIASSAVEEILSYNLEKPVMLAETGAVEPRHAGPSKYYPLDTEGIMLHDILFAPFFVGAAGTGMSWHWESYVHKNNLWYHYSRFNEVIKDINPIKERFQPSFLMMREARAYRLSGQKTQLIWIRDRESTWSNELEKRIPPREIERLMISADELGLTGSETIHVYDPWQNLWTDVDAKDAYYILPTFKRSVVIRYDTGRK